MRAGLAVGMLRPAGWTEVELRGRGYRVRVPWLTIKISATVALSKVVDQHMLSFIERILVVTSRFEQKLGICGK
jgi:hypothetical protein